MCDIFTSTKYLSTKFNIRYFLNSENKNNL